MKILMIVLGSLVALIVLIALVGALLPKRHEVSRSVVLAAPPEAVFAKIADVAASPRWRRDVQRVELLDAAHFREHGKNGAVTYELVERDAPRRLVTRIADRNLGYSGSWTYDLAAEGGGTRVTITERGEVTNVIFRFLSRFVFGHTATIDRYLGDLQRA
ncbi:MAG TPA: SRPBCC family protein [Thermoanaerobaculia bacterium]|jgi:uncharacterized protein YndB with AHSA1/START domain